MAGQILAMFNQIVCDTKLNVGLMKFLTETGSCQQKLKGQYRHDQSQTFNRAWNRCPSLR